MDEESSIPEAKRAKSRERRLEELRPFSLLELAEEFNWTMWKEKMQNNNKMKKKKKLDAFICYDCGELCLYAPQYVAAEEWTERPYCDNCTIQCSGCAQIYVAAQMHLHRHCVENILYSDNEEDDKGN